MENSTAVTGNNTLNLAIGAIRHNWHQQTKAVGDYFAKFDASQYQTTVAPGRNKAIHLLGHLIASNDDLLPLLGFGERLFPEMDAFFVPDTDWDHPGFPSLPALQNKWAQLIETLDNHIDALEADRWMEKHTRVSETDFAIDSTRNKLNVLIGRILHMRYHLGQLNLIRFKEN